MSHPGDPGKSALWTRLPNNVFSKKGVIEDASFTSTTGDGTAILRGHPSHPEVLPLAGQRQYL